MRATTLEVRPVLPALLGDDCGTAPVHAFEGLPAGRRLVVERRETPRYFRFSAGQAADVWVWPEEEADAAATCGACDDDACATVDGGEAYQGGPNFVLRIEGAPSQASGFADFVIQLVSPSG